MLPLFPAIARAAAPNWAGPATSGARRGPACRHRPRPRCRPPSRTSPRPCRPAPAAAAPHRRSGSHSSSTPREDRRAGRCAVPGRTIGTPRVSSAPSRLPGSRGGRDAPAESRQGLPNPPRGSGCRHWAAGRAQRPRDPAHRYRDVPPADRGPAQRPDDRRLSRGGGQPRRHPPAGHRPAGPHHLPEPLPAAGVRERPGRPRRAREDLRLQGRDAPPPVQRDRPGRSLTAEYRGVPRRIEEEAACGIRWRRCSPT